LGTLREIGVLALAAILLAAPALAAASGASSPPSTLASGGNTLEASARIAPHVFEAGFNSSLEAPEWVKENLTSLGAGLNLTIDNSTCTAHLSGSLQASGPGLEGGVLELHSSGSTSYNASLQGGLTVFSYDTASTLSLYTGNSTEEYMQLNASIARHVEGNASNNTLLSDSHADIDLSIVIAAEEAGPLPLGLGIEYTGHAITTVSGNSTAGSGNYTGTLTFESSGESITADFTSTDHYNLTLLNQSTAMVTVSSYTSLHFSDYFTALLVYQALEEVVDELNLSDYVTLTPPSYGNPTVGVDVEYEGTMSLAPNLTLPPTGPAGLPGLPGGGLPLQMPAASISLQGNHTLSLEVENGTATGSLEAWLRLSGTPCEAGLGYALSSAWLNVTYAGGDQVEASGGAEGYSAEPFTSGLLAARGFHALFENVSGSLDSASVTLEGVDGVMFDVNGSILDSATFDLSNYTLLNATGVAYGGAELKSIGGLLEVGPNATTVTLPPVAGGVLALGADEVEVQPPLPLATHDIVFAFQNSIAPNASLTVHAGAGLAGTVKVSTMPASDVGVGLADLEPIGPALAVEGVNGNVTVKIPVETTEGDIYLLVIHDNGTIDVVGNVTVTADGYLIANATASTTYLPVVYTGSQPPTSTGSSTTPGSPATTSPGGGETTTTTGGSTTTTPPATTTSTPAPPATTSSPGGTTTSTTGQATSPTGTSGAGTSGGTTQPAASKSGSKTAAVAAGIAVLVILVAAAYLVARR
jgi:hypothetical protein